MSVRKLIVALCGATIGFVMGLFLAALVCLLLAVLIIAGVDVAYLPLYPLAVFLLSTVTGTIISVLRIRPRTIRA